MIRATALVFGLALADSAVAQERPYTALPSPVSATCPGGLCQPEGLLAFFGAIGQRRPVTIVQFGDSHTAGGDITRSLLWRLQSRFQGVPIRLQAHGVVGATLNGMAGREELFDDGEARPDLVIIAYGTNEGFDDLLDPGTYERLLRSQIERVRETSPGTAILILGAPEAMRGDGGGRCPGDTDHRWKAPEMLSVVRDLQHRVAASTGVAFWDWRGRMGGDCSAFALTRGEAPLMRGDHVHFTGPGGDWIGSLLAADILAAYDRRAGGR
ncbi:GDSL-type esterase/lipase family protein [Brevundimonas sp.]|uniref:GDSL-type esterase/lipase family protein n=1 Tax=Brevundimonas sp. TaxID=1871086 RepID=UPI0026362EFB|nr:GDSL-type esterase/lipase family protein [Brevundimonas sp.]